MGLEAEDAVRLADELDDALRDGRIAAYVACNGHDPATFNAVAEMVARASREYGIALTMPECPISVQVVKEFIAFLRSSGGFWIG